MYRKNGQRTEGPWLLGLLVVAGLVAAGGAGYCPGLDMLGCAASGPGDRYNATLQLRYQGGRLFSYETGLTRLEYDRLDLDGRRGASDLLLKARKALAEKLGYHQDIYGKQNEQYVTCAVEKITIADERRGKTRTVFESQRREV